MIYCAKCGRELYRTRRCKNCQISVAAPKASNGEALASANGSLPVPESVEFLISQWIARAEALEEAAQRNRDAMMALNGMNMEKARAYRQCAKDLRRHAEATSVRQPAENGGSELPAPRK